MQEDRRQAPVTPPTIADYYERGGEETRFQTDPRSRLEFARTLELLKRHLPPHGRVLDVGGGTGPYASWLADAGYDVELFDPIQLHVDQARALSGDPPRFSADLADARSIPRSAEYADVVLFFGPLYHLIDRVDRSIALAEGRRVLRPGGTLLSMAIGRFAWLHDATRQGLIVDHDLLERVVASVRSGQSVTAPRPGDFYAYFHRPKELKTEIEEAGFEQVRLCGVESFGHLLGDLQERLDQPDELAALLEVLAAIEEDQDALGTSNHLFAIARKPGRPRGSG